MDDSISYAVEIVTNVLGAKDATQQIGQLTSILELCVKEGLLGQKTFNDVSKVFAGFTSALQAVGGPAAGTRAVLRAMGKEAKDLGLSVETTGKSLGALKGESLVVLTQNFRAAREAAQGFNSSLGASLETLSSFGRAWNSQTAFKNQGLLMQAPLADNKGNLDQIALQSQMIATSQKFGAQRAKAVAEQAKIGAEEVASRREQLNALIRAEAGLNAARERLGAERLANERRILAEEKAIAEERLRIAEASLAPFTQNLAQAAAQRSVGLTVAPVAQAAVANPLDASKAPITRAQALEKEKKAAADAAVAERNLARAQDSVYVSLQNLKAATAARLFEDQAKAVDAASRSLALYTRNLSQAAAQRRLGLTVTPIAQGAEANPLVGSMNSVSKASILAKKNILGNFYPLIVAAGLFTGLSRAMLGFAGASIKTAADYQQAFASVARTTSTNGNDAQIQIENIRKALLELSTQLPVTFQDLSKVATAGNQLGIAAQNIPQFTKTVAEFSSITGQSNEDTAKSFGSLIQILHLSQGEYNNLASSVTLVGRKSVATEVEVLAMTTKIGAIAHVAGFSASETVGLAAAFSSLREPVERSQGALTTYTKVVDKAAAAGGEKFQKFADVLQITSAEAQRLLRTNPYQFFRQFIGGLSQLDAIGKTSKLSDLGLGNIRVSEVLTRLADNLKVVDSTQKDAAAGFKSGTDLSNQYAQATNTLVAKFKELQNAVSNLLAAIGNSAFTPVLTSLLTLFRDIVVNITIFVSKNQGLASVAVALAAIVGVVALVRAGMIATAIAAFALEGAFAKVSATSTLGNIGKLAGLMFGVRTATNEATASTVLFSSEAKGAAVSADVAAGSTKGFALALGILKGALLTLGIGAALVAIGSLASVIEQGQEAVSSSFNSDDLASALRKDQTEYEKTGKSIRQITTATEDSKSKAAPWVSALQSATGAQVGLSSNTEVTTKAIKKQTIAYGENAKAVLASSLANNTALQDLYKAKNLDPLKAVGFDVHKFARVLETQGADAGEKFITPFWAKINAAEPLGGGGTIALNKLHDIIEQVRDTTDTAAAKAQIYNDVMGATGPAAAAAASGVAALTDTFSLNAAAADYAAQAQQQFATQANAITSQVFAGVNAYFAQSAALEQLGQDYINNGATAAFAGQGIQSYIAATVAGSHTGQAAADQLQNLVNAMVAGGYVSGNFAVALQYLNEEIARLGGSSSKGKADISFFLKGISTAQQQVASSGGKMSSASNKAADALDKQAEAAQKAADRAHELAQKAQDAAAAFRTTSDYASDLGTVLQRAFDIQFAPQQASDAIATAFNDLRKNASDATGKIRDARKEIQGINADIAVLQSDNAQQGYFLGIANAFGDRIGAASIQAQMAKNRQDIADKQASKKDQFKNIDDAFGQLDTATVGNSDAAIRNRAALTGLVGNYQDLITKLAASGLNQKELTKRVKEARANFLAQGEALGYSKKQLEPYSKALEGFNQIIAKVPRKVSVEIKSNVSAAQNTLNEFYAKLKLDNAAKAAEASAKFADKYVKGIQKAAQDARKKANDELGKIGGGVKYNIPPIKSPDPNNSAGIRQASLETLLYRYNREEKMKAQQGLFSDALDTEIKRITNLLADHQFRFTGFYTGGYTGPGGKYEPAGLVHKGEYVVPKHMVNQQTGIPYADALGRLVAGTRPQAGYAAGGYVNPEVMVVEPGPVFKRELRNIVQQEVAAVIEPRAIAGANQDYLSHSRRRGSTR